MSATDEGVFRRAMGADFDRLHPQLQRRFGVDIQPQMFQLQPRFVVEQRAVH